MFDWQRWEPSGICRHLRAAAIFTALLPGAARAAITITAPSISLPYSTSTQSGIFEVWVQSTASPQTQVGAFNVEIQLPSFSSVTFPQPSPNSGSNTTPTVHPYIFPGQSPTEKAVNSGRTIQGTDNAESTVPTLGDGAGLLSVTASVPAGATGFYPLTFVAYSPPQDVVGTVLFDQNNLPIATTDQNGSITILPPTAYWRGSVDANWTTDNFQTGVTNWTIDSAGTTDTHIAPGASTDVFFIASGAANLNTTLGGDFSIKGLAFTSNATTSVTIGGGNTLTIGADGLTVQAGSAAHTINAAVSLGGSQTWRVSNAAASPLTVGGTLRIPASATLTKTDVGTLVIGGAPTFGNNSSLAVNGGAVKFNLTTGTATIGTGVTATLAAGATLELAGSVSALANGAARVNVTNSSTLAGGGLLISGTNQQLGAVTGTGNLTVDAGSDLTVNSIVQSALIIGGTSTSKATVAIRPSDASGNPLADSLIGSLEQSSQPFAAGLTGGEGTALPTSGADSAASIFSGASSSNFSSAGGSVPEPSTVLLALVAAGLWFSARLLTKSA
ncbi:MAG TPA: hypothetical protein VGY55_01145 [Pirellulales bacterium]|nr:hypothetical protein [Pirellulales bacterium]